MKPGSDNRKARQKALHNYLNHLNDVQILFSPSKSRNTISYKITYMLTSYNIALVALKLWVLIDGTVSNIEKIHSYNLYTSYNLHNSKAFRPQI